MVQFSNLNSVRVMEPETISKNGASLKSQTSRRNIMQKTFLLFAVFCVCVVNAFAQDVITLKNGDDIQALVQEIGESDVKYKKFDNPNGPNYTLKKSEIFMIRYANGSKDVFNKVTDNPPPIKDDNVSTTPKDSVTNTNFKLKKSSKILVESYGWLPHMRKKNSNKLVKKMTESGFCCVYRKTDENETAANYVITMSPNFSGVDYHIRDTTIDKEVFYGTYFCVWSISESFDKFIKAITPFIEE